MNAQEAHKKFMVRRAESMPCYTKRTKFVNPFYKPTITGSQVVERTCEAENKQDREDYAEWEFDQWDDTDNHVPATRFDPAFY